MKKKFNLNLFIKINTFIFTLLERLGTLDRPESQSSSTKLSKQN